MVMETGSILRPVSRASSPITSCRYSGIVKKTPIRIRFWLNRPIRPERSGAIFSSARCTSGSRPLLSRRPCHAVNAHSRTTPKPMTKTVSEKPNGVTGESSLGLTQPQVLDCSTPRTTRPRPAADSTVPTTSSFGAGPVLHRVGHLRGHHQDQGHQQHLAGEDDPPRVLRGRPAAQDRPHGDPCPGDPADHGVRHLARGALEVARDQRHHRRQDQRGTEPFQDRPAQGQDGHRRRQRRHRRTAGVDDQADDERPPPADDVADLAAGEHEHRHHQAVERDHRLDRGHRRVEVGHQRADRDIHRRLVQHHDELGDGQGHQRQPVRLRRWARLSSSGFTGSHGCSSPSARQVCPIPAALVATSARP